MNAKYGATLVKEATTRENLVCNDNEIEISIPFKRRRWWQISQKVLYGLGHVHNDLCAAMWFSYMMLYFQAVLEMKAAVAGAMLLIGKAMTKLVSSFIRNYPSNALDVTIPLGYGMAATFFTFRKSPWTLKIGQVVDALATPIVGILADKYSTKKIWHLTGCVLVTCTFPLLFVRCLGCDINANLDYLSWWMPLYYASLIVVFQIGWAIVQISHLAIIPSISDSLQVRSELTSIRYMASVLSSLTVYFITWIVLKSTSYSNFIGPADDYKFKGKPGFWARMVVPPLLVLLHICIRIIAIGFGYEYPQYSSTLWLQNFTYLSITFNNTFQEVSLIITAIGITTFVAFHLTFKSRQLNIQSNANQITANGKHQNVDEDHTFKLPVASKILYFLQMPLLYQTSLLYVFSRLYWALSLVYVPLFLEERLSVNPSEGSELVASVPLVLYISSLFFSFLLKSKISSCGNQMAYFVGSLLSLISCLWIALAINPQASIVQIYLVAALIGAGSAITLVSSLCVTADLIGPHSHQGASVYSIVTFADKLVTGIAVVAIENYKCDDASMCPQYYRGVLTYACGGSAVLGIISLSVTMFLSKRK